MNAIASRRSTRTNATGGHCPRMAEAWLLMAELAQLGEENGLKE
jgi:hypothetical protein